MTDKRYKNLSRRFDAPGTASKRERTPGPLNSDKPERARQSLHFANQSFKDLGDAYLKAEHDVYPQKLQKANFVEALISVAIKHIDEVVALALEQQAKEEEEE